MNTETSTNPLDFDARIGAVASLVGHTGATGFQVRFSEEEAPIVWLAVATYPGGRAEADAALTPEQAVWRLAERLVDGGRCMLCGRPTALAEDEGDLTDNPFVKADRLPLCQYRYRGREDRARLRQPARWDPVMSPEQRAQAALELGAAVGDARHILDACLIRRTVSVETALSVTVAAVETLGRVAAALLTNGQDVDLVALRERVLRPGDRLIFRVDRNYLTDAMVAEYRARIARALGDDIRFLVVNADLDVDVVRPEDGAS